MYIYTSKQIKAIDQAEVKKGMSLFSLMENAGNGLFQKIFPLLQRKDTIIILAGKGNNGGDGIVLARYLKNHRFDVKLIFPLGKPQSKTAIEQLDYFYASGYQDDYFDKNIQADWIIDALLGVGSRLPLRSDVQQVAAWINDQKARKIAIDLPTGVASDHGDRDQHSVNADFTFSLHGFKPSAFLFPATDYYGEVSVIDIGVPHTSKWKLWTDQDVRKTLPRRIENSHKGSFGNALLVGGSDEMPGSVALAAIAAFRFGIGKLTIATSQHAASIIGSVVPEATFSYHLDISKIKNDFTCIGIGPGLIPNQQLEEQISELLNTSLPVVLDAGALSKRKYRRGEIPTIITPHSGEFSRLIDQSTNAIQKNRLLLVTEYAEEQNVIVVLKGKYTVIAFPDGILYINPTGNTALSKGGTGDSLTGMLLASISTHKTIQAAVANAVYMHGACADDWIRNYGEATMLAHDFDRLLPKVYCHYSESRM